MRKYGAHLIISSFFRTLVVMVNLWDELDRTYENYISESSVSSGPCSSTSTSISHRRHFVPCVQLPPSSFALPCSDGNDVLDDVEQEVLTNKLKIIRGGRGRRKSTNTDDSSDTLDIRVSLRLRPQDIASALVPCACAENCYKKFSFETIKSYREIFWNKKRDQQFKDLRYELMMRGYFDSDGVFKFSYGIYDKQCCSGFFEKALPISHGRLSKIRTDIVHGDWSDDQETPIGPIEDPTGRKACEVEQFIIEFAQENGEGMPDKDDVHLPEGFQKEDVYVVLLLRYNADDIANGVGCSLSYFYRIWRERCFHVKIRKWKKFSACSACANIRTMKSIGAASLKGTFTLFLPYS